jgi:hypothetical protein
VRKLLDTRREQLPAAELTPYDKMRRMEVLIPQVTEELSIEKMTAHGFCDGVYCRRFELPKDAVVVSKIHKKQNWFVLFSGEVSIYDGEGNTTRIKAPYIMVTQPGTKRIVYAHEDAVMYTFHGNPDNEQDITKLEDRYIIPEAKPTLPSAEIRMLLENKR